MTDFNIRSDNVDVEQIMKQIRSRIREKRGVDYTEQEIRELANVKLEKFLDPRGVRSDLLQQFRRSQPRDPLPSPPNFKFEDTTLFESNRSIVFWIRKLLKPILKLFFNPQPIADALNIQAKLNAEAFERQVRELEERRQLQELQYEVMHNLVVELTRLGIEVKNLKMRVESMSSRLDFDERRARALEGVVQYRPGAATPLQPPPSAERPAGDQGERRTRRRRRRGRRRPGQGESASGPAADGAASAGEPEPAMPAPGSGEPPSDLS